MIARHSNETPTGSARRRCARRDPRAIARAITLFEDKGPAAAALVRATSPPGRAIRGRHRPARAVEKARWSTVDCRAPRQGRTVVVVAVIRRARYRGAVLGDRCDADALLRLPSSSQHGDARAPGGLSRATSMRARAYAAGKDASH